LIKAERTFKRRIYFSLFNGLLTPTSKLGEERRNLGGKKLARKSPICSINQSVENETKPLIEASLYLVY